MRGLIERLSGRREYRLASLLLIAALILFLNVPLVLGLSRGWGSLDFAVLMSLQVALVVLTYFRLRNASLSVWWLLPMLMFFDVGPRWELASWGWGSLSLQPSGLISLVPVIIGWFAIARDPQGPAASGTL